MNRIVIFLFLLICSANSETKKCRTSSDVIAALQQLEVGDTILLEDGIYEFSSPVQITTQGLKEKPIIIKAKNRNKAIIKGKTFILLRNASFITIEGLVFNNTGSVAVLLEGCNNIRITRNIFRLKESGRGSWVWITGNDNDTASLSHHNIVDRNLFENKKELGNFVTIEGTNKFSPSVSQYDLIEWNYFRDIGPRVENVLEAIRAGSSIYTLSRGFTVLQNNLFERCDGDPEYVSIKLSDCAVKNNTFRECLGSLSLRHGNNNTIDGNFILGNDRTGTFLDSTGKQWTLGTGGVRFCADSMTITNNYFEGLTGTGWDATIAATNGDADYSEGKPLVKHFRIRNAVVSNNIMVNNASNIEIGFDGAGFQNNWWAKPPQDMVISNNIVVGSKDTLIKLFDLPINTSFKNNFIYAEGKAVPYANIINGVELKNPKLKRVNGLLTPTLKSISVNKIFSSKPLTANDVGPNAK
jgi:poly(beta-D-mannuronate) lyase